MISIIITSFKEPETIGKCIESILNQDIKEKHEIIVACPDEETKSVALKYKGIKHFQDPGKGKSFALNLLFKKAKGEILIFTDGDVYLAENAINNILKKFEDSKVGFVGGRVVSQNNKNTMLGYWSHLLADVGAHRTRQNRSDKEEFFECSGYLMAMRSGIIKEIPLDVAEDSIIPYYFFKQGHKIVYAGDAKVFVKNPTKFRDWLKQRKRTAKAHTKLNIYEPEFPKMKSFKNEIKEGFISIWSYPKTPKEIFWTDLLCLARLYMWLSLIYEEKIRKKYYNDGWDRVQTTKA
ncbi:glycosyltransferase [Candidatus Woesearchaeota archaeon]|nr:glycosyltransferase [Candidatus Woesearchaeota archaeon]